MPRNFFRSFGFVEVDGRRTLQFGAEHARTVKKVRYFTTVNYNCKLQLLIKTIIYKSMGEGRFSLGLNMQGL